VVALKSSRNSPLEFTGIATVNKEMHIDVLLRLRNAVNAPKSGEPTVGFFFTTMLQQTGHFSSRISEQRTMWQHWSITHTPLTWLQANFYLFPRMKSTLNERLFCDANDIITNATKELKRLPQKAFQECCEQIFVGWLKFVVAQGGYFEGNVAYMIVLFCISQK